MLEPSQNLRHHSLNACMGALSNEILVQYKYYFLILLITIMHNSNLVTSVFILNLSFNFIQYFDQ